MPDDISTAAMFVEKGGVGKTTTTAHLGVALVTEYDRDVVLIDLSGRQNDLATQFGVGDEAREKADSRPFGVIFSQEWDQMAGMIEQSDDVGSVADVLTIETGEGPDLIPADPNLGMRDNQLATRKPEHRYGDLRAFVDDHLIGDYDVVLFDLPGKESNITLSGIAAADHVVAPVKPGAFEREQLASLEDDLRSFADDTDVDVRLSMIIPTQVSSQKRLHDSFIHDLADAFPDRAGAVVPDSQNIPNLQAEGQTIISPTDITLYPSGRSARDAYVENAGLLNEVIA